MSCFYAMGQENKVHWLILGQLSPLSLPCKTVVTIKWREEKTECTSAQPLERKGGIKGKKPSFASPLLRFLFAATLLTVVLIFTTQSLSVTEPPVERGNSIPVRALNLSNTSLFAYVRVPRWSQFHTSSNSFSPSNHLLVAATLQPTTSMASLTSLDPFSSVRVAKHAIILLNFHSLVAEM